MISVRISNLDVLIDDIRRQKLAMLAADLGGVCELAKRLDRNESQISQWLNGSLLPSGKKRGMRSDTARWIEGIAGKPVGWLDTPDTGLNSPLLNQMLELIRHINDDGLAIMQPMLVSLANSHPRSQKNKCDQPEGMAA